MSLDGDLQHSLRIGDAVLLYSKDARGYVFSELSSSKHNSVAITPRTSGSTFREPRFDNVHVATFYVVVANKNKAQERYSELERRIGNREMTPQQSGVLHQARKEVEAELRDNEAEQERLLGNKLVYGENVQLCHMLTGKHVSINSTLTSRTENTCLRVELCAENSPNCIFKILPRYKVRSVGDVVRYNDQVKFESVKTEGQFLHCSARPYGAVGFHVLENSIEMNLSGTESALTVIPHYRPSPSHDPKTFKANQAVRLFHRENECYIAAEGSFAEDQNVVVEDVHCRKRKTDHGILKAPSTSSNTYWQIEKESDPRSGEPLSWGERCRIRHMPTRRYLAVVGAGAGDYRVTLTERQTYGYTAAGQDLETVFSLSPVIQEGDTILFESYARIKHLATRTWLHLDRSQPYKRRAFDPAAPGLQGLEWDNAELFMLKASETMNYDDAFTLEMVQGGLVDKFNYVAGIVPVLTTHLSQCGMSAVVSLQDAYLVAGALQDLAHYISAPSNDRETKNRQKLLRNLRIFELIISILGLFKPDSTKPNHQRIICQACYLVIESYLRGDSRKNENYLARFIGFFQQQVGMGLNAEKVMIEMVEDNTAIVSKMATSEIGFMMQRLVTTRDPRFLLFLSNLCVCNDRPIPSTQGAILDNLVKAHGKSVFFRLEVGGTDFCPDGKEGVVYFRRPGSSHWQPLLNIASRDCDTEADDFEFLDSQLLLFGKMCQGNNETCIRALDRDDLGYVTFQQAEWCVQCTDLHPSIASKYVELIKVMFVDVGENRAVLENLSLSFVYEDVVENPYEDSGGNEEEALTGVINIYFPAMKKWLYQYLSSVKEKKVVAKDIDDNCELAKVLEVLALLIKYGYYDDPDDVEEVLRPLVEVMNGLSDLPFLQATLLKSGSASSVEVADFMKGGRYKENEENKAIFTVKERAIEVIDLLFNFRFYVRLQRFIYEFRQLRGQPGATPTSKGLLSTVTSQRPPMLLRTLMTDVTKKLLLQNPLLVSVVRDRLKVLFSKSAYFFEGSEYAGTPFTEILIDMSCYHSDEVVQGSLHLLNRYFSAETSLFDSALQTQLLLTEESKEVFKKIEELLPILRRLLSVDLGEASRSEVVRILETFTAMCHLPSEESEPHTQNQKILYNFGVLSDVLDYVLEPSNVLQREATPGPDADDSTRSTAINETVYVQCFLFLRAFARRNLEVQCRLYDRMDDLLEIEVAVPHMAMVLIEVFTGGPEIPLRVKEEQVERIFHLLSAGGSAAPDLLQSLQSMVKVDDLDLPIKRNQAFVIKSFSKSRDKFCDHLLGDDKKDYRWTVLVEFPDDSTDLQLLLAVTDLLASCAEGENLFIESVCQTIYKVEELLLILSHPRLSPERKRPFARFLIWVYLNTEGDKHQSGASSLSADTNMWEYLEHLSTLLENIGIALRAIPDSEHQWVREGLSMRGRTTSTVTKTPKVRGARTTSRNVLYVTSEGGELKPGVLLYFVDGVLPLVRSFFANLFSPPKTGDSRDMQLRVTDHLLTNLLTLCDTLMLYLSTEAQVRLYRSTVVTLLKFPTPSMRSGETAQLLENFDAKTMHSKGAPVPARENYEAAYSEEMKLNEEFHKFVANFQLAYQGPNTARDQIGAKYDTPYSDFLDEESSEPGDEYLPLGPSFQEHVGLYVRRHEGGRGLPNVLTGGEREEELLRPETARLITQLEISFHKLKDLDVSERQRQDELDVKSLRILRAIVHNEIVQIDPQLKEDDPTGYRRRCTNKVQPVQNKIQSFGNVMSRVVPLLSHPNDEIVREVLAFLKVMLFSGNRTVQHGFEHLLETREERLFTTMRGLLQHAAVTYIERRTLLAQVSSRNAAEEALLSSFVGGKRLEVSASLKRVQFQESVSVAVELLEEGGKNSEYVPMGTLGGHQASEEGDSVALVTSPTHSAKKSPTATRRARISSKPALELLDLISVADTPSKEEDEERDPYAGIPSETMELLKFQDSAHIKLALKVLGLMCDGQFRLMQSYLREQKDNILTINLVGEVALFAQHFYTDINQETMELVHLILQTLIETCVGNFPNQEVIYNRQVIDVLNTILQLSIGDYHKHGFSYIENLVNLKGSAVELIEAMLEETNARSRHLAKEIAGSLDLAAVYDTVGDFYELMNDSEVKAATYDDEAETGLFRAYHIIVHLKDYGNDLGEWNKPPEDDTVLEKAFQYSEERSRSIEINYENMDGDKILTKVNFHMDPASELREEVVEKVKWQINRDSAEDKLRDFLDWMYALKEDTLHHRRLHQHWFTRLLVMAPTRRYYFLLILTLLLNVFVLITFNVPDSRRNDAENATWPDAAGPIKPAVDLYFRSFLLFILGAIHLLFSLWMVIEYFVVNYPNFILPLPSFFYTLFQRFRLKKPERTYSSINIYGLRTLYVILFLSASILSLAFYGYFYALCLLHIVINNDILQRVLRSVTKNGIALLWVAALGGVILYIYSVITFAFLHESADNENSDDEDENFYCNTLAECFVSVVRFGLLGNLGEAIQVVPDQFKTFGLRILFDVSFFIIITTIGLNIVFGIIVDTFSELRDERFRTEQDKKSFCFICSLPNHEFERRAKGFEDHVKKDHNMWTYIYFSIYLDTIDISDHNAIEKFVYEMIHDGKIELFPVLKARCLETEEDETAKQLEALTMMVTSVLKRFKEEEQERTQRTKRQEQEKWEATVLKGRGSITAGSVEESLPPTH